MKTNERIYVDLHVLQTVPPSCVNRDDTGSPKTAIYGGVTRARVSSQAWKHVMRQMFEECLGEDADYAKGYRTKNVAALIADEICRIDATMEKAEATSLAKDALSIVGIATEENNGKEEAKKEASKVLFFISKGQVQLMANWALKCKEDLYRIAALPPKSKEAKEPENKKLKAKLQKEAVERLKMKPSLDQALFGRMVASNALLNYDASAQVAHAISTHAVENEYDYFTAVDDCLPEGSTGAGHLGTVEFNSSTMYRYATVNVGELVGMLGEKTPEAVRAFAEAFIRSMPTGKQNTFANRTRPDAVYVTVRRDQPINMAGAFEKPIRAGSEGYAAGSVAALVDYAQETYKDFAAEPERAWTVGKGMEELAQPGSVNALLDALELWLKFNGEQK